MLSVPDVVCLICISLAAGKNGSKNCYGAVSDSLRLRLWNQNGYSKPTGIVLLYFRPIRIPLTVPLQSELSLTQNVNTFFKPSQTNMFLIRPSWINLLGALSVNRKSTEWDRMTGPDDRILKGS